MLRSESRPRSLRNWHIWPGPEPALSEPRPGSGTCVLAAVLQGVGLAGRLRDRGVSREADTGLLLA